MPLKGTTANHPRVLLKTIFQKGRKARDKNLLLHCLPAGDRKGRTFIMIRKEFGTAVERNRAKRQIREIVRAAEKKLNSPFDIIILVREKTDTLKFEGLKERLNGLYQKTGIIK